MLLMGAFQLVSILCQHDLPELVSILCQHDLPDGAPALERIIYYLSICTFCLVMASCNNRLVALAGL